MIRNALPADAASIAKIYNHFIINTVVTFEEEPVEAGEMLTRIQGVQENYPWLVYELDNKVVGYAYASRWKVRAAYRHTVEISVYLEPGCTGRGLGRELYQKLIDELKGRNIHAVIGGVAMPNDASVKLHESLNFNKIGVFSEVGFKFGKWVDVAYWELILPS